VVLRLAFQVRPGPDQGDLGLGDAIGPLLFSKVQGPNDLHFDTLARPVPHTLR